MINYYIAAIIIGIGTGGFFALCLHVGEAIYRAVTINPRNNTEDDDDDRRN